MRGHRFIFSYAADPLTLSLTGIVTERPNGLLGAFGTTPPGSFNVPTKRLQFDTVYQVLTHDEHGNVRQRKMP